MNLSENDIRKSTFTLIPYAFHNGSYTVPDLDILKLWETLSEKELDKVIFWRGTVQNGLEMCAFCKNPGNFVTFILDDHNEIRGAAWLNHVAQHTAYAHWCITGTAQKAHITAGQAIMDMWLRMGIRILFALIPVANAPSRHMSKILGFQVLGRIPDMCHMVYKGKLEDGELSYKLLQPRRETDG